MFDEVGPIAMTQPSWGLFVKLAIADTGSSPLRGLDNHHLEKGPAAFAQCVDLNNKPFAALREYNPHLAHLSLMFYVRGDDEFHTNLISVREIMVTSPAAGVYYVSAMLDQWVTIISRLLMRVLPERHELQRFLSVVYGIFRSLGLKDLWIGLSPEEYGDITLLT